MAQFNSIHLSRPFISSPSFSPHPLHSHSTFVCSRHQPQSDSFQFIRISVSTTHLFRTSSCQHSYLQGPIFLILHSIHFNSIQFPLVASQAIDLFFANFYFLPPTNQPSCSSPHRCPYDGIGITSHFAQSIHPSWRHIRQVGFRLPFFIHNPIPYPR